MSAPASGIDAYRRCPAGVYAGTSVVVRRRPDTARQTRQIARTEHFDVGKVGSRLLLEHGLDAERISDDVAGLLAAELFEPGWVRGPEMFEELMVGIVLSCADDPSWAWMSFYRNTLRRLAEEMAAPTGEGSIAAYAPVHAHVSMLLRGRSVLELGTCFGFQALRLAADGWRVAASDISPGSIDLLANMSRRLEVPVATLVSDAARVDAPARCADTVLAIHLLEHVPEDDALAIVRESCRLARERVVIAVPFEDEPAEQFGHLRTLSLDDLRRWATAADGWHADVHEHHGGWLVLDRP